MSNKILPLGSVVTLRNGDGTELLIVSRASVVRDNDVEVYYDYGGVLIPQGMVTPDTVYFFNRENVQDILFKGFENDSERAFCEFYDEMISQSPYSKGGV